MKILNNEKVQQFMAISSAICLIIITLITSIKIFAFSSDFYLRTYSKLNIAEDIGISEEDLMLTTDTLLTFLDDESDNIKQGILVNNNFEEAFNEKEVAHMRDVKVLYQKVLDLRIICIIIFVIFGRILIRNCKESSLYILARGFLTAFISIGMFFVVLVGWACLDFDSFWTSFHQLFFANDLWLLNPATDLLIQMYPSDFFFALIISIVALFSVVCTVLCASSVYVLRKDLFPQTKLTKLIK